MNWQNTLIKPDGTVSIEKNDSKPYFHSEFFGLPFNVVENTINKEDMVLTDGKTYIHTKDVKGEGLYILVIQTLY